eukprot:440410-Pyramimonas_sp.AAC.1
MRAFVDWSGLPIRVFSDGAFDQPRVVVASTGSSIAEDALVLNVLREHARFLGLRGREGLPGEQLHAAREHLLTRHCWENVVASFPRNAELWLCVSTLARAWLRFRRSGAPGGFAAIVRGVYVHGGA